MVASKTRNFNCVFRFLTNDKKIHAIFKSTQTDCVMRGKDTFFHIFAKKMLNFMPFEVQTHPEKEKERKRPLSSFYNLHILYVYI